MDDLLTLDEVATILGYTVHTLRKMRSREQGPESIIRAGRIRYRPEDVHQWLAEQDESSKRGGK